MATQVTGVVGLATPPRATRIQTSRYPVGLVPVGVPIVITPPDTQGPTFAGARYAVNTFAPRILVVWDPGTDNQTASENLRYRIFRALQSGAQNFAAPLAST